MRFNRLLVICFIQFINGSFCPEDTVKDQSSECKEAAKNVEKKFPNLEECTKNTGLFFSTLEDVCKDDCRDTIINASAYIAENCPLNTKAWKRIPVANSWLKVLFSNPTTVSLDNSDTLSISAGVSSGLHNGLHIYHGWKSKNVTELACKRFNGQHLRCLKEVISAADFMENSPYWKPPKDMTYDDWMESNICSECKRQFYHTINPGEEPTLYYWHVRKPNELRAGQEKYCKFDQEKQTPC